MGEDHSTPRRGRIVEGPRQDISVLVGKAPEERRPLDIRWGGIGKVEPLDDSRRNSVVSARGQEGVPAATLAVQGLLNLHGPNAHCFRHEGSARSSRIGSVRSAE